VTPRHRRLVYTSARRFRMRRRRRLTASGPPSTRTRRTIGPLFYAQRRGNSARRVTRCSTRLCGDLISRSPFRLLADDALAERRLLNALAGAGLTCARHGPFHHAGTVPGTGTAVRALTTLYRAAFGAIVTVGAETLASSADRMYRVGPRIGSRAAGLPAPRTQVEWLERIVQDVDQILSPERAMAADISIHGDTEIPSSQDSPLR
jgi:hypothetical protein